MTLLNRTLFYDWFMFSPESDLRSSRVRQREPLRWVLGYTSGFCNIPSLGLGHSYLLEGYSLMTWDKLRNSCLPGCDSGDSINEGRSDAWSQGLTLDHLETLVERHLGESRHWGVHRPGGRRGGAHHRLKHTRSAVKENLRIWLVYENLGLHVGSTLLGRTTHKPPSVEPEWRRRSKSLPGRPCSAEWYSL